MPETTTTQPQFLRWLLNINLTGTFLTLLCGGLFLGCAYLPWLRSSAFPRTTLLVAAVVEGLSLLTALASGIACIISRWFPIEPIVTIGVISLAVSVALPVLVREKESCGRVPCASNLRQIGQGLQLYAIDHNGLTPSHFEELINTTDLNADAFVCPRTKDHRPDPRQTLEQQLAAPGHRSYRYLASNRRLADIPNDIPIVVEDPANHDNAGAYVLFGDGHVDWLTKVELDSLPTTVPTTFPTTRPHIP